MERSVERIPDTLAGVMTPAAAVDLDVMEANLSRMAAYTSAHGLALRPHTKTHKSPEIGAEQIRHGAVELTVATLHEAHVMAEATNDLLIAHPPVGAPKLERLLKLPADLRVTVALDSAIALDGLSEAAARAGRTFGVLVEADVGMRRVGIPDPERLAELAAETTRRPGVKWRGIMFYPGHIRQHVSEQDSAIGEVNLILQEHLDALRRHGLEPEIVSAGSTPAAFASHRIEGVNEIRPGTYVYNDRTTQAVGACEWKDCAYSVVATVVSTAVPGQAVVDAGSKALSREELRGPDARGFGALLDRPEVVVSGLSEEHGILDLSGTDWRPRVGDRVRIVPNHVCVSVNLHPRIYGVRGESVERCWSVVARGWT
ncbi:MAG: D-TA family PLP-dependent enzyme [Candidatus Cloacimonetes bacterium]|nr:D-TA family PLP-dependent enzyme [Candidatus Cloacimonadota bacterium]